MNIIHSLEGVMQQSCNKRRRRILVQLSCNPRRQVKAMRSTIIIIITAITCSFDDKLGPLKPRSRAV